MNPVTQKARPRTFEQTLGSARQTMLMSEILKLAMDSFRASKTRFMLTALGMVIGTASVILVVTIGMTGKQYILELIQKIGTNSVELEYAGGGASPAERVRYNDYLTLEDERIVDQQVPGVMYSSPVLEMHNRITFPGGTEKDTTVLGVSPDYEKVRNLIVTEGRFFDEIDDSTHARCAVVTQPFAKERYGSDDAAVGQTFEILGLPFTIDVANDPFFGRVGQIMAVSQRQQALKFELLIPYYPSASPTACMSFNYHREHFGQVWGIHDDQGELAHTSCVAFGIDRLTVALFAIHGLDLLRWPASTRAALAL